MKLVKIKGEFVWHKHDDTDEVFIVLDGKMKVAFGDSDVTSRTGEMLVIPKGAAHKPSSMHACRMMVVQPAGTLNTENTCGDRTVEIPTWI